MRSIWPALTPLLLSLTLLPGCGGGDGIILPDDGEPATITVLNGNGQQGRVGEPLTDPLVVQVTDTRGRPVPGATVAFQLTSAGSDIVPHEKTTDANGMADARVVLGTTVGPQSGMARVVTPAGRPAVEAGFSVMALSENANSMTAVSGQDQSGHVGSALDERLVVEVTDGFGNPVPGVPISWVAEGGGSVSDAVVETDENGRSRVERTLGPTVGPQSTVASSAGLAGSPVTFIHTALAGNASRLVVVSGNGQSATIGSTLPEPLVVRLVDADGNGIPSTAVSWVVATGGGSVDPEISTTDDAGRTSANWTLGDPVGEQRLDAVVSGVGVASFRATATSPAAALLAISTQPSGSARNGVPFGRQPVIQLRDGQGHEVATAGVQVSVAIGSGGGTLGGTTRKATDGSGRVAFTDLSITGDPGRRTLLFTASGLSSVTSNEIDLAALSTNTTITGDSPDPSVANTEFPVEIRVTSAGATPTGSVTVTVSGGPATCTATLSGGVGSCTLRLGGLGLRTITASYAGAPGLSGSSDTEPHTVVAQPPPPPENKAPKAEFDVTCSDLTCTFADKSTDDDGSIVSRSWNYGDGSSGTEASHSYAVAGTYQVTLTVTDNGGAVASKTHDAKPKAPPPQNQAPTAAFTSNCANLTCSFNSDGSNDSDGKVDGWSWTFGDGSGSTQRNPSHPYAGGGSYTVTLTVTDNDGAQSAPVSHTVSVLAPNAAPQGQADSYNTNEDTPLTIDAPGVLGNDSDPNGDGLSATNASNPAHGTVALSADGSFVYTPDPDFNGSDSFTYRASDGTLQSGPVTVTVNVSSVNDAPVAQSDGYTAPGSDQPLTVSASNGVLANDDDADGTALTAQKTSDPSQGSVTLSPDGSFTYTPVPGATGQDSFTYAASDGALQSSATVTITLP